MMKLLNKAILLFLCLVIHYNPLNASPKRSNTQTTSSKKKSVLTQHSQNRHRMPLEERIKQAVLESGVVVLVPTYNNNTSPTEGLFLEDPFRIAIDHLAVNQENLTPYIPTVKLPKKKTVPKKITFIKVLEKRDPNIINVWT